MVHNRNMNDLPLIQITEDDLDFDTILRLMFNIGYPALIHDETAFQKWKEDLKQNREFKKEK